MTRQGLAITTLALSALNACQKNTPETRPIPNITGEEAPTATGPVISPGSWSLVPSAKEFQYHLSRNVIIGEINRTSTRRDSTNAAADFSITVTPGVESSRIIAQIQEEGRPPLSLTAHITAGSHRLTIDLINGTAPPSMIDCRNSDLAFIGTLQRLILIPPVKLHTGMTWSDSLSITPACMGPIPAALTMRRSYRVLGDMKIAGVDAIMLEHIERTTASGEGSQEQHHVSIRGEGSGAGQTAIDAITGAVLEVNTTQTTRLNITASGRTQTFQQEMKERATRRTSN